MGIMALTGLMLGTISYETMQDYHTSTQSVAGLYTFNDALDEWETVLEDYVVNSTEIARQGCLDAWDEVGMRLDMVDMGEAEAFRLAEENLSAVYGHIDEEMDRLLLAESGAARTEVYAQMVQGKEGMLFLSDQLLRLHTDNAVREYPDVMSINVCSFVILVLILVFSAILLTMCSRRMIRSICAPIDLLVEEAKKVAGGQYDTPDVTIFNDDEMGYLSQVFNNMKAQVSANFKNMERILELQELLKSTELKALQSQINPHFLFNVLGLAEEAALYENADVTVEIIENISYMLQYSLKCTKQDTTFQEELRMVQAYLFLQERRFGDRIHFRLSVPEGLPQIVIPGMSVQPVVENAIQHGLENMERGGEIQVLVRRKETCIEVTIRDNGCGMEPELLAAIRRGEEVSTKRVSGGIGLVNVSRRMEIFYKQTELVDIASELDKGTTVTLRYPCREGEEAECTNCW